MKFDFSIYLRQDCHVPLYAASFFFVVIAVAFVCFFKNKSRSKRDILEFIIALLFFGFCLGIETVHLSRGGINLLFEKEADQVQIEGTVEEITEIDYLTGAEYYKEEKYRDCGQGQSLVVNGETYYLVTCGDTKVGDYVYLSVLPKSHFVMEIRNTPD